MKPSNSKLIYQMGGYTPTELTQAAFVPTYAGTPLEDAKVYGQDLLNTYKANIADLTKLDIANAQRKVLAGDMEESAKYDAELKAQFEEMAKRGDYENMTAQVNELARRHFNNKDIKAMSESWEEAQKAEQHAQRLRDMGKQPWFYNDPAQHRTVVIDPETGKKTLNVYRYKGEAPLEHQQRRSEIWDKVKPDAGQLTQKEIESAVAALPGYIRTGEWKGLSGGRDSKGNITGKVGRMLNSALATYEGTNEYAQEIRHEMEDNNLSEKEAKALIRKRVIEEGLLRTFREVNPQYLRDYNLEDAIRKKAMEDEEAVKVDPTTEKLPITLDTSKTLPSIDHLNPVQPPNNYVAEQARDFLWTMKSLGMDLVNTVTGEPWPEEVFAKNFKETYKRPPTDAEMKKYREDARAADKLAKQNFVQAKPTEDEYRQVEEQGIAGFNIWGTDADGEEMTKIGYKDFWKTAKGFEYAKRYNDMLKKRAEFPAYHPYASLAIVDPTIQNRMTNEMQDTFMDRLYYDPDTKQLIPTRKPGSSSEMSEELAAFTNGDRKNIEAVGALDPFNSLGTITGNRRFSDAEIAILHNPKTGVTKQVLVTKPDSHYQYEKSPMGFRNAVAADVWENIAMKPGQRINHRVNGTDVIAEVRPDPEMPSPSTDAIVVYKIGKREYPQGYRLAGGYNELVTKIVAAPNLQD